MPEGIVYYPFCEEHDVPLNPNGTCPDCRDASGQPFILDMQSIYLVPYAEAYEVAWRICASRVQKEIPDA